MNQLLTDRRRTDSIPARVLLVLVCALPVAAWAQQGVDARREYNVKAVSIYGFARYTTWPETSYVETGDEFVIGVLGTDRFAGALEHIAAKKTVNSRSMRVQHFATSQDYSVCQILFISGDVDPAVYEPLLRRLARSPVLVVGETQTFIDHGGAVSFYLTGGGVKFWLDVDQAKASQLRIHPKLMALGTQYPGSAVRRVSVGQE